MTMDKNDRDVDQAWETRVLCSDESCIGVIGPDGRCKECGLKYQGALPFPLPLSAERAESVSIEETVENTPIEAGIDDETDAGDEWSARKLCRDESCIGVIGPDGRCKECGRPYDA